MRDFEATAVFVKVVEVGSFRGAAQQLRIPKSTVSHRVTELETKLGVRLLERTTRALRLTDAGRQYHAEVSPALEALEQAARRVSELQTEPSGVLRLTAPVELGQLVLGGVVAEFAVRHPKVVVLVDLLDRRVDLVEEGFDLAIRSGPLPDSTLMARKVSAPVRLRLFASRAYLKRHGAPRRPEELAAHSCLSMSGSQAPTLWRFEGKRGPILIEVTPRISVNSFRLLGEYVRAGLGIAYLPAIVAAPLVRRRAVVSVLDDFARPAQAWHAVYPSARFVAPKVRAFVEILESHFARPPWSRLTAE